MKFSEVIGQKALKDKFIKEIGEGRVPHAQLFQGPTGCGKLPLAMAYAQFLLCEHPLDNDACGTCPSCVKMQKMVHPDLHFVFPVIKQNANKPSVSDDFMKEWRSLFLATPYFGFSHWLAQIKAENKQPLILVQESDEIARKMALKSSEGGYKIVLIWLPERMNVQCANKLLKLLEEPPLQTLFLLVSEAPEQLLPTILSRTQRILIPPLEERDLIQALQQRNGLLPDDAASVAHLANGSYVKALETIYLNQDAQLYFELFVNLMRLSYQRKIKEMKRWSETLADLGRERQKAFLQYAQHALRENFISNFRQPNMLYMNKSEHSFAQRFAPFIHELNCMEIMDEFDLAQRHIEQNVNAKMVFFDLSLRMIVLIKRQ